MSEFDDMTTTPPPLGTPSAEERQWALFAHLSALIGLVIPLGNVIGPLIIWQVKKDTMPFAAEQAKEALNFNITVAIAAIICFVLFLVVIGMLLLPLVALAWVIFTILAAVKANEGVQYRYPFTLRLVS